MPNKHDPMKDHPEIIAVKNDARSLRAKEPDLSISQAIELVAQERGFKTYAALRAELKGQRELPL